MSFKAKGRPVIVFSTFFSSALPKAYVLATLTVCPIAEQAPQVNVHFSVGRLQYNETLNSAALLKMREPEQERNREPLGLTQSGANYSTTIHFDFKFDSEGHTCLYFTAVDFYIAYHPVIYISKDVLDRECTYNVVRVHEKEHVLINVKALKDTLPELKPKALAYLRSLGYFGFGPYPRADVDEQKTLLVHQLGEAIEPFWENLHQTLRERQGVIDTEENYAREAALCPQDRKTIIKRQKADRERLKQ